MRRNLNDYLDKSMGILRQHPGSTYWIMAQEIAEVIVASQSRLMLMDSPAVGPVPLIKFGVQAAGGVNFFMTFRVKGENGLTTTYTAKVLIRPADRGVILKSLEKVIRSAGNSKKTKKVVVLYEAVDMAKDGIVLEKNSGVLRILGFNILLEQIRDQRPSLKFTAARKAASSKWRKLPEHLADFKSFLVWHPFS